MDKITRKSTLPPTSLSLPVRLWTMYCRVFIFENWNTVHACFNAIPSIGGGGGGVRGKEWWTSTNMFGALFPHLWMNKYCCCSQVQLVDRVIAKLLPDSCVTGRAEASQPHPREKFLVMETPIKTTLRYSQYFVFLNPKPALTPVTNMAIANVTNVVALVTKTSVAVTKLWLDFTQTSCPDATKLFSQFRALP